MASNYTKSSELYDRAFKVTGTKRGDLDQLWPVVFERGEGALVWDLDGNKYIDYTGASGAVNIGYSYQPIMSAVQEHLRKVGNIFITKMSHARVELAERLLSLIKGSDYVSFHKTGSCAASVAVRYAKIFSGGDMVLSSGYHGWHDWQLNMFEHYKIPDEFHINFGYDLDALEFQLSKFGNRVACVIVTPEPHFFPVSYYRELEAIVKRNGKIFILDEVASGFRYSLGGFQAYAELNPDLSVFGKGLANEFAIAAVVGNRDIMTSSALRAHTWSTYDSETSPMVASLATLDILESSSALTHMHAVGQYFLDQLILLFDEFKIRYAITPYSTIFHIIFNDEEMYDFWIMGAFKRGVVLSRHDYQLISYTHSKELIDETLPALRASLEDCKERWPENFGVLNTGIDQAAMSKRAMYEFGGTLQYRASILNRNFQSPKLPF